MVHLKLQKPFQGDAEPWSSWSDCKGNCSQSLQAFKRSQRISGERYRNRSHTINYNSIIEIERQPCTPDCTSGWDHFTFLWLSLDSSRAELFVAVSASRPGLKWTNLCSANSHGSSLLSTFGNFCCLFGNLEFCACSMLMSLEMWISIWFVRLFREMTTWLGNSLSRSGLSKTFLHTTPPSPTNC